MNKVLVKIFFPRIDKWFEVWIPLNQKIENIIIQLIKGINEINANLYYTTTDMPILYNRGSGEYYEYNSLVQNTNIKNGSELILI